MNPDTVHLLAQLIRHNRGIVTAFEKWIHSQPDSVAGDELLQVLAVQRSVLSICETQLSAHPTTKSAAA